MNHQILIIPDVHGRPFWHYAEEHGEDFDKIIFLGDYVDPYSEEHISPLDALNEFKVILDFYEAHPDKVVLLLGNHDLHYYSSHYLDICACDRYDEVHADQLHALFTRENIPFQLAHEETIGNRRYLFTHAGVTEPWLRCNRRRIGQPDASHLNRLLDTNEGIDTLAQAGLIRGGYHPTGSIVWADSDEIALSRPLPNVYQIFAHSQQLYGRPIITDNYACIDCRSCFCLTDSGTITQLQKPTVIDWQ